MLSAVGWKTKKFALKLKAIAIEVEQILDGIRGIFFVRRLYIIKSIAVFIAPTKLKSTTCHVIDWYVISNNIIFLSRREKYFV